MLTAEAVRLAAIEILCPTAAIKGEINFPTLAGGLVCDSREIKISELDKDASFTPVLGVYTAGVRQENRSETGGIEFDTRCVLEVVGELAVVVTDDDNPGAGPEADAMAGTDPEAKLVLAALMAQVKFLLEEAIEGRFFRQFVRSILQVEEEPFAVPELGLRWQRITQRYTLAIGDDIFDFTSGKPKSLEVLLSELPQDSYAREKLTQLLARFPAQNAPDLLQPDVMQGNTPVSIADRKDPAS
jgi:hypothetical protein